MNSLVHVISCGPADPSMHYNTEFLISVHVSLARSASHSGVAATAVTIVSKFTSQ